MRHASMTKSFLSAVVLLSGLALAQQGQGMGRGPGPHGGPPPEAVQACANLRTGTACAFTLNGQNLTGTCDTAPSGQVACRPEGMPPPPPGGMGMKGPPQEALAACANLSADAACSFTMNGNAVTGTCTQRRNGSGLVCHPAGMGPGGGGQCMGGGACDGSCGGKHGGMGMGPGRHGPPAEAKQACANLSASAACSFTIEGRSIAGTCLNRPMGGELVCHPNDVPMGIARHGPPQASIDACQGKAANAACSFVAPHGQTMTGTCFAPPNGKGLACRPSGM